MKIIKKFSEWKTYRNKVDQVGFVPTMGALHEGHIALIQKSLTENPETVVSIFLNPTQFNSDKDLENYPSTINRDIEILSKLNVSCLLTPKYNDLYPDNYTFRVSENNLSHKLCGRFRPGHFDGVLTVVLKLLNIVRPQKTYFGEKDFQQFLLIKKMADAFFIDTEIIPVPTVREPDGLAMSSRNALLPKSLREKAHLFYQILNSATSSPIARKKLEQSGFVVDYVEEFSGRRFGAIQMDEVRLIDNVAL